MRSKLVLFLILGIVFWRLFLPFPHVAGDLHHLYDEGFEANLSFPPTFREFLTGDGLGERIIYSLWSWAVHPFFAFFGKLGIDFTYQMMLFGFLPIFIFSTWGVRKIFDKYKVGEWGKVFGALFYVTNSYLILLMDGGQITLALAYSLIPLAFYYFMESIEKSSLLNRLIASFAFLGISIFDPRVLYLLGIILFLRFLFLFFSEKRFSELAKNYFLTGTFIFATLFLYHLYWLLPAFFVKGSVLPQAFGRVSQAEFLSFANLGHALFLQAPNWFKNVFGKVSPLSWEFIFIPLLVFLAPILKRKDKNIAFWLIISLVGVFLAKGVNEPFGGVYSWLFVNVPGFSFFRDSTKFFFLVTLSYSVLIGITVDELTKRFKWRLRISKWKITLLPLILVLYFLILVRPVWLGKMTGTFARPIYQEEYFRLSDRLRKDEDFARVLWIPTKTPLGYASPVHPAIDAFKLLEKRPFASAVQGTYELFNFLRTSYMGQLFDISGIAYIIYPFPDERREELKQDNIDYYNWYTDKIANFPWIEKVLQDSPVEVFETKSHQDRFFVASNVWWVVGSDDIYSDLGELDGFKLSDNAMIFAEERPGLMEKIGEVEIAGIIINKKSEIDLAASLIDQEEFIFPAKTLDFSPNETGWWKRETVDLVAWRGFLQQKYGFDNRDFDYGGGWAVGEGNLKLEVRSEKLETGEILLARVMQSPKGGRISFYQDGKLVGEVETKEDFSEKVVFEVEGGEDLQFSQARFSWVEVGELGQEEVITIQTQGDINVVNAIAVVDQKTWLEFKSEAAKLLKERKTVNLGTENLQFYKKEFIAGGNAQVTYERVSPTHYKIKVVGLEKPKMMVFSSNYDPLWGLDGREGVPIYSFLNGFVVEKDGSYEVVFSPQKYVYPAILLSLVVIPALILSIIILRNNNLGI